jgi:hypothetical protein
LPGGYSKKRSVVFPNHNKIFTLNGGTLCFFPKKEIKKRRDIMLSKCHFTGEQ